MLRKGYGLAYTKHQRRKKEESERLREQRDQIKFIDLRFERSEHGEKFVSRCRLQQVHTPARRRGRKMAMCGGKQ